MPAAWQRRSFKAWRVREVVAYWAPRAVRIADEGAGMPTVRLIDGTEVDSASEEWRHEAEARAIAALPSLQQRRAWLEDIQRKRGQAAADRIRETLKQLWKEKAR